MITTRAIATRLTVAAASVAAVMALAPAGHSATPTAASLAPSAAPSAGPTRVETTASFASASGDTVGQGGAARYNFWNASITASGLYGFGNASAPNAATGIEVLVRQRDNSTWYSVDLAPAAGTSLHVGTFTSAQRADRRTAGHPGLDVAESMRNCATVYGSFAVKSITTVAGGRITSLDATFTQRCNSATAPPLTGEIRYNVTVPAAQYSYRSDSGDYIGQGGTDSLNQGNAEVSLTAPGSTGRATLSSGAELHVSRFGTELWSVVIEPAAGGTLHAGTFSGAQRAAFKAAGHPGLEVTGQGRGCNTVAGSFTVTSVKADTSGRIVSLSASFTQHCEGLTPALHGTVLWNV